MKLITRLTPLILLCSSGCTDVEHDHDHGHEHGVITTLVLTFTPEGGGDALSFRWSDPAGDANLEIDDIVLPDGSNHNHHDAQAYALDVEVWNDLEDPPADETPEIAGLADQHQFFFTGTAVKSPATGPNPAAIVEQAYDDSDDNGLPLGLENTVTTTAWGSGELTVTLRHMPDEDGEPVKVEGLAQAVADNGFGAIGGDNDIHVSFPIVVQ